MFWQLQQAQQRSKEEQVMSDIESAKEENRVFNPSPEFTRTAAISGMPAYEAMCAEAAKDYEGFWGKLARENLQWQTPFTKVLDESKAPFYEWFNDGKLNAS